MPTNHALEDILALGVSEMPLEPTVAMPGIGFVIRNKVYRSFRLADGLWHYFRFTDPHKAEERDAEYSQPMLKKQ